MPATKMLPVRGSLREFRELDSSPQDQRWPRQVFSTRFKETLAKKILGVICLALFCAGTVFLEYKMLLLFGAAFVVFAAACALAVISGALYRAPEGDERADGLHIRQRNRPRPFCEATAPDLLAARSAAPDQRHVRHSLVPGSAPNDPPMKNLARVSQER